MSARTWHKGPPPHVGWWNASRNELTFCWRWWDGQCWSIPVFVGEDRLNAGSKAKVKETARLSRCVAWSDYYPKGARVPRVAP